MTDLLPLLGIPVFFIVFVAIFRYLIPRFSDWGKLAERYGTDQAANTVMGERIHFGQLKIGRLRMKNMVKGYKTHRGLFLTQYLFFFGKQPNLLIPWEAFQRPERRKVLFINYVRLPVGNPVITELEMMESVFNEFADRLPKTGV